MTPHAPVIIYRPGTEVDCGPREDQLVILPGVAIEEFVRRIVECGFPLLCHVHCKDPARHVKYDFPMGQTRMVFTDGQFTLPADVTTTNALCFFDAAQLTHATYLAHIRALETDDDTLTEVGEATQASQVFIVSTYKAPRIRRMFADAGLDPGRADLTFYRGSLL